MVEILDLSWWDLVVIEQEIEDKEPFNTSGLSLISYFRPSLMTASRYHNDTVIFVTN